MAVPEPLHEDRDFAPPKEFDDYEVVRELGRGQMGQVYLAEDVVLARHVAIKFIANEPDAEARQRFLSEARTAARIQHPNVVGVYRVGELGDRPYIVSELVRGKSLADVPRPMPAAEALQIAIDLARGLAAAHRRGVVHCDIKPGNAMLTDDGIAKLVDFGLARVATDDTRPEDGDGPMIGTPDYMAPEVWGGRTPSRRSDVYSFGAVVYEMLAGAPPFADVEAVRLATVVRDQPAPDLAERVPGIDGRIAKLVARCLERDPEARYPSGEELREALEQLHSSRSAAFEAGENPYRGLRPFESTHRGMFFGRSLEIGEIVERLRTDSIVIVTGDSGVGKSSLCRAGVIPAICDGAIGGGVKWEQLTMVPGRRPLASLAAALGDPGLADRVLAEPEALPRELRKRAQAHGGGIVMFVDQMEELVTVGDRAEVEALDQGLARISEGIPGVRLVTTVRADFLSRIATLPRLGRELARLLFFVSPLGAERIREVITGPAAATGIAFESDDMIETLVEATAEAGSGGLPLLSFALAALWEARDRERAMITVATLEEMGGVAGALARHGDAVLSALGAADRQNVRRVLLRLVTSEGTRVRRTEAELAMGDGTRQALDALVKGRLLVVHDSAEGPTFEVAHEVLVRGWGTLRDWLDTDAKDIARRERVAAAAGEWNRAGRRRDLTWAGGPRLVEAQSLDQTHLTELEKAFITASVRAAHRRKWLRRAAVAAGVALVLGVFLVQRHLNALALAESVAEEVDAARVDLETARAADREQQDLAIQAYAKFDADDNDRGEALWKKVVTARTTALRAYRNAGSRVEAALAKDPTRDDVRALLGDLLIERALLEDTMGETDRRDELLSRLAAYDADGSRRARWAQPGKLVVRAPAEAEIVLDPEHRALGHGRVETPLQVGSYIVVVRAPGRETVRAPVVISRGRTLELALAMPRAGALPDGFVYVPEGEFLYGASGDEPARAGLSAVPVHTRTTRAFLIARNEVTTAEWLAFVEAQPATDQAKLLPSLPPKLEGGVVIARDPDKVWRYTYQPTTKVYAVRWGEPLSYEGRQGQQPQDWRRFPITGVTATMAEQYVAWLDRSGRVPGARLCDELEWERAGRGADGRAFPHGDHLDAAEANVDATYGREHMGLDEVGSHAPSNSPFGLSDMSGNAFEWTYGPKHTYIGRGGSYFYTTGTAIVANRNVLPADLRDPTLGLRVCAAPRQDAF